MCVCVCVRAGLRACMRARVHVCVRACVCMYVCDSGLKESLLKENCKSGIKCSKLYLFRSVETEATAG